MLLGVIATTATAQGGLSDEDDDEAWEAETLDAIQPVWIQNRGSVSPTQTLPTLANGTKPKIAVTNTNIALPGAKPPPAQVAIDNTKTVVQTPQKPIVVVTERAQVSPFPSRDDRERVREVFAPFSQARPTRLLPLAQYVDYKAGIVLLPQYIVYPIAGVPPVHSRIDMTDVEPKIEAVAVVPTTQTPPTLPVAPIAQPKIATAEIPKTALPRSSSVADEDAAAAALAQAKELQIKEKQAAADALQRNNAASAQAETTRIAALAKAKETAKQEEQAAADALQRNNAALAQAKTKKEADDAQIERDAQMERDAQIRRDAAAKEAARIAAIKPAKIEVKIAAPERTPSKATDLVGEAQYAADDTDINLGAKPSAMPAAAELDISEKNIKSAPSVTENKSDTKNVFSPKPAATDASNLSNIMTVAQLPYDARDVYATALEHYRAQNYSPAIAYFEETIKQQPTFADAYRLLVECYEKNNNYTKAIKYYEKYLTFFPNSEKDWFNLSLLYGYTKNTDKAIAAAERSVAANPDYEKGKRRLLNLYTITGKTDKLAKDNTQEGILKHVTVLYKQQKYTDALARIKDLDAPTGEVAYIKGVCLRKLNRDTEAIAAYAECLATKPDHIEALAETGVIYYNQKVYDKATDFFGRASARRTTDPALSGLYGRALLYNKEPKRAIAYLERASSADPTDATTKRLLSAAYAEADTQRESATAAVKEDKASRPMPTQDKKQRNKLYNDGLTAYNEHDYAAATGLFLRALTEDRTEPRIYYMLGLTYFADGDNLKAIPQFNRAIEIDGNYIKAYEGIAKVYYNMQDGKNAIMNYEKAIKRGSTSVEVLREVATVHALEGNYNSAAFYYLKAIEKQPNNAEIYYNYGTTLLLDNKFNAAVQQFKKTTELNPKYLAAYFNMGQAQIKMDNFDDALKTGQRVIAVAPDYANGYVLCAMAYNRMGDSYNQDKYERMAKKYDGGLKF